MTHTGSTTALARSSELDRYMAEVNKIPLLSREEEDALARKLKFEDDLSAAHTLVVSNLRFVAKIAYQYRHYGLRLLDIIQEGNLGLMRAVKSFDPDRGYRLISYAVWWIRAEIQNFILKSWSLVKLGTGKTRRKLFFGLRKQRLLAEAASGNTATLQEMAEKMGVTPDEVEEMDLRLAGRDFSLDMSLTDDGKTTMLDLMDDPQPNQEELVGAMEERRMLAGHVAQVMENLNEKERYIVDSRLLNDDPETLQSIGEKFSVSRERVRQLEKRVIDKLRDRLAPFAGVQPTAAS